MTAPSGWALEQAMSAAMSALARMEATGTIDTDEAAMLASLRDAGADVETLLVRVLRAMTEARANWQAVSDRMEDLALRQKRYALQAEEHRRTAFAMLDALGMDKFRSAEFTVTISAGNPGVVVTDADALPAEFVRVTRSPDKAAIARAMADGVVVNGAEMQNGMPTMTVRTK